MSDGTALQLSLAVNVNLRKGFGIRNRMIKESNHGDSLYC